MSSRQVNADRAVAAYNAMQQALYVPDGRSLYRETSAAQSAYAFLWPFSRAHLGTVCLAGVPAARVGNVNYRAAVQDRHAGLARYWNRSAYASAVMPPFGPGGDIFYDDNAWVALTLVLEYRMGLLTSLDRVKQLFQFAQNGWDRVASDPCPGGVFWVQQGVGYGLTNHDRGTGANAGSAEVGLHLHELTGSPAHDGNASISAANMIDWILRCLDGSKRGDGPFLNVVRREGTIDTNIWSYNQGVMLGARVLQYRLTRDARYLHVAEAIARQTLTTFGDFTNHPPSFNAMCFQNMLMLHASSSDTSLKAVMVGAMENYADWAWDPATGARDAATDLFSFDDAGRPARGKQDPRIQDQGALTQLYALLAWEPSEYGKLT